MSKSKSSSKTAELRTAAKGVGRVDAFGLTAELLAHAHSTAAKLAGSLGLVVESAHVADVRISGNSLLVSRKARGKRRQWLIAQGIANWALDQCGDIQTPSYVIAEALAPNVAPKKAVRRAA